MRTFLIYLLLLAFLLPASAQEAFRKNTIYGELAGNGLFLSLHYERQLGTAPGFAIHAGVGYGEVKPAIPVGVNYLFGLSEKSFLETGAGITLAERNTWDDHFWPQGSRDPYRLGFIPSIGYRHHTPYGLMWRVNYTPVFTEYRTIPWLIGISLGWRF